MQLARRVFVVVGALFVVGVLVLVRTIAFGPLEEQAVVANEVLLGSPLDLASAHAISWDVPVGRWRYREGEAKLSLVVDRAAGAHCDVKAESPLRVRVSASGLLESGEQHSRLVRNWYYTTDEPLAGSARLWEAGGPKQKEFGLAGIAIYPRERLRVIVDVLTPAPQLAACNPRLQLAPNVDYAIAEHVPLMRGFVDGLLATSVLTIAGLAWLLWDDRKN